MLMCHPMARPPAGSPCIDGSPITAEHNGCHSDTRPSRAQPPPGRRLAAVDRPYVLLSCAMSLDGYIDDRSGEPLRLSGDEDLDRVDELRAGCDAILVGAGTIRADNPVLMLRSAARRDARLARGARADPVRVVLSAAATWIPLPGSSRPARTGSSTCRPPPRPRSAAGWAMPRRGRRRRGQRRGGRGDPQRSATS